MFKRFGQSRVGIMDCHVMASVLWTARLLRIFNTTGE